MASKSQSNKEGNNGFFDVEDELFDGGITVFFRELGILKDDDDDRSDKDTK